MDLGFIRRAEQRFASRTPARLDFGMLVASLRTQRAATAPAVASNSSGAAARLADPLAEILLGGPCWREAVAAQRGCFNAAFARQAAVN